MDRFDIVVQILEKSILKHGEEKVLTLSHLLNIFKLADRIETANEEEEERLGEEAMTEFFDAQHRYGTNN